MRLFAQGDLLIERVEECAVSGHIVSPAATGETILAEGEATGHHHALRDSIVLFRDDSLARDIPSGLYVAHMRIEADTARLTHPEHGAITIPQGTYRVRRQRLLEPDDFGFIED
jgi:hypothetical protein